MKDWYSIEELFTGLYFIVAKGKDDIVYEQWGVFTNKVDVNSILQILLREDYSTIETFPLGGMWESPHWKVHHNRLVSEMHVDIPCPHCHTFHTRTTFRRWTKEYPFYETKQWVCPRVIIVDNEGGCNSTGLCLDCVLDAYKGERNGSTNTAE